jgi:hypothetical protein
MIDHLHSGNLKDAGIALIVGLALAAFVGTISGCSPSSSAQLYQGQGLLMSGIGVAQQLSAMQMERQQQELELQQLQQNR